MVSHRVALRRTPTALIVIVTLSGWASGMANDWPHWRGPSRDGHVTENSGWDGSRWQLTELWSKNVGIGSTSPLVVDGKLYTLGWENGRDRVVCLDAATGEELWHEEYRCPQYGRVATGDEGLYGGPTATPEFDVATETLFTMSTDGDVIAWKTDDNQRMLWKENLYDAYKVRQRPKITRTGGLRDYGYTTAPLIFGEHLLVEVGDNTGNLSAFDKKSGKRLWTSVTKDPAGHTGGAALIDVEGVTCLAVLTAHHLVVTRLDVGNEGEIVGRYEWKTDFANNIASPAAFESSVLITSAYNKNAITRLDVTLKGIKQRWEQPFPSKVCTPVIHNGHIYYAWRRLRCLDWETGTERWEGGDFGEAGSCIVTGDDRLITYGKTGLLVLTETASRSPASYKELARIDNIVRTDAWPHVVLANGKLFCKDWQGNLTCFHVGK
ncbi:MAG: PQQ-binding-like beta-propeller repeat protein [Planctomycetota bacterium]|nr:PQQ-binding-like beta-propeller repeat protein [Planctomycetota bacterium]